MLNFQIFSPTELRAEPEVDHDGAAVRRVRPADPRVDGRDPVHFDQARGCRHQRGQKMVC